MICPVCPATAFLTNVGFAHNPEDSPRRHGSTEEIYAPQLPPPGAPWREFAQGAYSISRGELCPRRPVKFAPHSSWETEGGPAPDLLCVLSASVVHHSSVSSRFL